MPIYEYRCEKGHTFEVMQKMADEPMSECARCDAPVERVFHPIAVHFKGKGFYNTDYGTRRRARELESSSSTDGAASETSSDKKADKASSDKPASSKASSDKPAKPAASKGD